MATREELEYLVRVNDRDLKELKKNVDAVNKSVDQDLGKASSKGDDHLKKLNRGALIAAAGIGGGLLLAAKNAWGELANSQKVGAQTNAVLKSTGGQANITGKQVGALADQVSRYSGIDDEAVQAGENMLLTFTNIRNETGKGNDVFNQSTKILADLATATGKDMPHSAVLLGKALNDPIRGITALTRVGVTFDDGQRKQIKTLVEHGRTVDAQKIILAELNKEFGGSAKAAGDTLPGQLNKARNAFDNMSADLLTALIPAITGFAGWLSKATQFLEEHQHATKIAIVAVAALAAGVFAINAALKVYQAGVVAAKAAQWLWNAALSANPIGLIILALVAFGAALVIAYKKSQTFRDIVNGALKTVMGVVDAVRDKAAAIWHGFQTTLDWVRAHWPIIATILAGPFAPLVALATNAFGIRSALVGALDAIKTKAGNIISDVVGFFTGLPKRLSGPLGRISDALDPLRQALGLVAKALDKVVDGFKWIIDHAKSIGGVFGKVTGALGSAKDKLNPFGDGLAGVKNLAPPGGGFGPSSISRGLWDDIALGRQLGLTITSGYRPGAVTSTGNPSNHGVYPSKAVDMAGSEAAMRAFFMREIGRPGISELIHSPYWWHPGSGIQPIPADAGTVLRDHYSHVHVGIYDSGGFLPPGLSLALNMTGQPERVVAPGSSDSGGGPLVHIEHATFATPLDSELFASAMARELVFR